MGKRAVLLLTVVAAMLLACSGLVLAQPATTPSGGQQRNADDRASSSRVNADDIENRGPPELKLPSKQSREEPASGQEATSPTLTQEATAQTSEQRANGAFVGPDVWADPATKIADFTTMVGTPPHVIMYYQNWEQPEKKYFDPAKMQAVVDKGATPIVTWAPRDPALGKKQPKYALKTIVAGSHDSYIRQWAKDAAAWGKSCQAKRQLASPCTMYLRFAHEMNGTWFPWSPSVNGNTASDFRAAWKRIHGIFSEEGATNVRWVWSPYINCSGCSTFSSVYPGDDYVDWVALDGYNWGTTLSGSSWQSMAQVFGPSYDAVTNLAPTKPFMIPEVSSAEKGGNKADWIRNAFNSDIPNRLPKTKAVVWFSADFTASGETDWRVNSSAASLGAYKEVAASDSYQGQLP